MEKSTYALSIIDVNKTNLSENQMAVSTIRAVLRKIDTPIGKIFHGAIELNDVPNRESPSMSQNIELICPSGRGRQ
ncbi:hypothetical protein FXO38_08934 [Capsicum annuum]|nr:hypothetical protein FXO38_08934 [Capsicum annuum]KAF3674114.1 hypothetical protein FXO37_06592 [Capsicum annuum]